MPRTRNSHVFERLLRMASETEKPKLMYFMLLILRFVLTLWPQSGYIHPDEFFQSPEVVYGDVFGLMSLRTWEFKAENPIRSIAFPYFTIGIPAFFMNIIGAKSLFGTKFLPYMLLVLPRLFMCFLSLLNDVFLFKLVKILGKKPFQALTVFSSSYVTLVYLSRTFSNTLETVCFTILNFLVITEFIELRRCAKMSEKQRIAILKKKDSTYYIHGAVVVIGTFIRPTFLIFAMTPVIFWFLVCLKDENRLWKSVHFTIAALATIVLLAFIDTVYYNNNFEDLLSPKNIALSLENMIFTPVNFIRYNLNFDKLSLHGCHPWYLHIAGNVPVMFSMMGIYGIVHFVHVLIMMAKRIDMNVSALELFMLLSFAAPVCFLSFIPHQELRFLLPLICPLICLYGDRLYNHCIQFKTVLFIWISTNFFGLLFFGFFQQGGMISAMTYLHTASVKNMPGNTDLVFYHTYMPPRHLLAMEASQNTIRVYDLAGAPEEILLNTIRGILTAPKLDRKVYIIIPSSITIPMVNVNIMLNPHYKVKLERKFFPHLSLEDLPVLHNLWNVATSKASLIYKIRKMRDFFSLNVFRIEHAVP